MRPRIPRLQLPRLADRISRRPGMYLGGDYGLEAFCALLLGFDLARNGRPLAWLKEWLVTVVGASANNLAWPALLEHAAGVRGPPQSADSNIAKANAVLQDFFRERRVRGSSAIRADYARVLKVEEDRGTRLPGRKRRPTRR
jgi:hypothetical protein